MQKSEDVVIPMNKNSIRYLVGSEILDVRPLLIYSDLVCSFLDDLSKELRGDSETKKFPDILTFAFWCRKGNITKLKESYQTPFRRIGRGMVFHIAPSNVPINFAFSLAFGLLAGNANVVRVSEKEFPQTEIVCRNIRKLLLKPQYAVLNRQIQVVSYGHEREINDFYSAKCDIRMIWGGDAAIEEIRRSPIPPRCTEITFADRYSFAVFDEKAVEQLSQEETQRLAEKFYNDTYLMDQNACSSPHLIFWINSQADGAGRKRFWKAVFWQAEKYDLPEKKVLDKYTILCEMAAQQEEMQSVQRYENLLYVAKLQNIPKHMEQFRGKFGLFYEADLGRLEEVCDKLSPKMQTCVTFGVEQEQLLRILVENHAAGIDRIVPVGEAMNIGVYWDGYDVIGSLSRGITVN